ncbi:MAG: TonB-dependent receptor domain-containing protein [Bryobacteraceae bacterium]
MSMKTLVRGLEAGFACILLFAWCSFTAHAQFRAGLQGVVTDANGAVVPEAKVTLTSQETSVARTVKTSGEGVFTIPNLGPGKYALLVEAPGFSKKTLTDLQVAAEQNQSVNVQLEVGQITDSVTVDAGAAQAVDTQTAQIGGTITNKEIQNLPSLGRDPYQLLRLAPGVFGDGAHSGSGGGSSIPGTNIGGSGSTSSIFSVENGVQITANGTRQNSNNFQVDGVSVNSTAWGGAAVITPNEESVKEVRVISNNYSAENGRTSGAQVEVVSQNGTNDLHGSAFFKWHRPGLDAYQRFNGPSPVQRDQARFNQFGGSLGGPLWKNKLFAFFSYETLRNNSESVGTNWYESPQFFQSAGAASSNARRFLSYPGEAPAFRSVVPRTCASVGLPSTQCRDVAGGLDLGSPLKTSLGTKDPTVGQAGTPYGIGGGFDGIPDAVFLETVSPNLNTSQQFNGRLDYNFSSKDLVAFSIYRVPVDTHSFNGPIRSANLFNHSQISQSYTGIYTHTFSPTILNEARFGVSGWNWDELATNPQEPWGLATANIDGFGGVNIQNFGSNGPGIFNQKTYNVRDTLSKVQGSHFLKFGGDYSRAQFLDAAPWGGRPGYQFRNLWDFANDAPYRENSNFDPVTGQPTSATKNLRFTILGFFVQDDWKVKPNLTLNLGLRWEYFSPLTETHGMVSNAVLGPAGATLTGLKMRVGGNLFNTSKNNWGPQLGFAWSPKGLLGHEFQSKLVLRGGGGVGYNLQQLAITSNGRFNPPFETSLTLFDPNILYALNADVHQFDNFASNPAAKQTFDPVSGLPTSGAPVDLQAFPSNVPSTVTYRYSLDLQYDLGHSWVASVGYQGSQSRHYTRQTNLNYLLYPNLNPRVNNLAWFTNDANAHFNALLTQLQHRFSQSFEIDTQYRYSLNTDQGTTDYYRDNYPWDGSHGNGPSDFDVTHNFKLYGIYTPKIFGGSHGFLEKVAGGWTISGIINAHSGFPFTPQYCNTGNNVVYPNSGFSCLYPAAYNGKAGSDFSNDTFKRPNGNFPNGALSYFTVPTFPKFGIPPDPASNIHRNAFRGPRYFGNDLTVAKAFGLPKMKLLGEGARLNLQANIYNLFNKLNLTNIKDAGAIISNDGLLSNPQFGQAQSALNGRIIELQARFSF